MSLTKLDKIKTIDENIKSVKNIKNALKTAIINAGGSITDKNFSQYADVINDVKNNYDTTISEKEANINTLTSEKAEVESNYNTYVATVNTDIGTLKTAIIAKGGEVSEDTINACAEAIENLTVGGGEDYDKFFKDDVNNPLITKNYLTFDDLPEDAEVCYFSLYDCNNLGEQAEILKIEHEHIKKVMKAIYCVSSSPTSLTRIDLPELTTVGNYSLFFSNSAPTNLTTINLPELTTLGNYSLYFSSSSPTSLTTIDLPKLKVAGGASLYFSSSPPSALESINLSELTTVGGSNFLFFNNSKPDKLTTINLPKLTTLGDNSFYFDSSSPTSLTRIDLPELTTVGNYSFYFDSSSPTSLTRIDLPELTTLGKYSLYFDRSSPTSLTRIDLPELTTLGNYSLYFSNSATNLTTINLPKLTKVGNSGIYFYGTTAPKLKTINLPELKTVGNYSICLGRGLTALTTVNVPKLSPIDGNAFSDFSFNSTVFKLMHTEGTANPFINKNSNVKTVVVSEYSFAISATNMFYYATQVVINKSTPPTLYSALFRVVETIYVPEGSLEAYQTATNYTTYADKMVEFRDMDMDLETGLVTLTLTDDTQTVINA